MTAAEMLIGAVLEGGWKVIEKIEKGAYSTGSNFSQGYIVENTARERAFCKALDYYAAMMSPRPHIALSDMSSAYRFERELLESCREASMNRVVRLILAGDITISDGPLPNRVEYLIFEIADGDMRKVVSISEKVDWAWKMRCLHNISMGIRQLHSSETAHQDLKPSNVLDYGENGQKIGDLGCASIKGRISPRDQMRIPGDPGHSPPELLYGNIPKEWGDRILVDFFMLGGLVYYLVTHNTIWSNIKSRLPDAQWPGRWGGSYTDLLPILIDTFDLVVMDFEKCVPEPIKERLVIALRQLCDPDPVRRGHPGNWGVSQNRYSLEQYTSLFDLLARRCEIELKQ